MNCCNKIMGRRKKAREFMGGKRPSSSESNKVVGSDDTADSSGGDAYTGSEEVETETVAVETLSKKGERGDTYDYATESHANSKQLWKQQRQRKKHQDEEEERQDQSGFEEDPNDKGEESRLFQSFARLSKGRISISRSRSNYNNVHENVKSGVLNNENNSKNRIQVQGVVGLSNIGNTCFMNSSLQCLSNTIPLTDYFLGDQYKKEINHYSIFGTKGVLVEAYAELMKELWLENERVVRPVKFKSHLESFAPQFIGTRQQDAQEVLAYLLDGIHEDLNRVMKKPYIEDVEGNGTKDEADAIQAWRNYLLRDKSIIVDIFQGQLRNTLTCKKCSHRSVKFDPFMYLSIPIPEDRSRFVSLDDCLELFCREELLTNENQWYCSKCKEHVDAIKKFDLWTVPPILIVHLKRFKHHTHNHAATLPISSWMSRGATMRSRVTKINQKVDFPLKDWKPSTARNANNPSFDLYAVSNHLGGYGSGHYTSYAMNRIDDEWYEFNDSHTKKIPSQTLEKNSAAAYLLFYNQTESSSSSSLRPPTTANSDANKSDGSSTSSGRPWSNRVPIIYKQSISRPENWPHLKTDEDDDDGSSFREYKRPPTGGSMINMNSLSSEGINSLDVLSSQESFSYSKW